MPYCYDNNSGGTDLQDFREVTRLLYYLPMERMKIEIEKSEYDRLKSREEKLMAYYEWFVDKENDLVTVEDIVNKNIELEEENKELKEIIKDRQFYEEKLEHRIIEFEELLHWE